MITHTFIEILALTFPDSHDVSRWWHHHFQYYFHSFTLIVGILIVDPLLGITLSLPIVKSKLHRILSKIATTSSKQRNVAFTDLFFAYSYKLLRQWVIVTLKNSKVYMGVLVAATEDPNETQRYIQVTPVTSGYREKETHRLILNTNYVEDIQKPDLFPNRDILIPVAEIITLTQFDSTLHARFINMGLTEVRDIPPVSE